MCANERLEANWELTLFPGSSYFLERRGTERSLGAKLTGRFMIEQTKTGKIGNGKMIILTNVAQPLNVAVLDGNVDCYNRLGVKTCISKDTSWRSIVLSPR